MLSVAARSGAGAGRSTLTDSGKHVDKAYEGLEFDTLADVPVDAPEGVSQGDAEALQRAFNLKTIRQLAASKFVLRAQAITNLAEAQKK